MTDVTIPVTPVTLKIGTFLIGTKKIGEVTAGDVWNDFPVLLPQESGTLLSLGLTLTSADAPALLLQDTADLKLGITDRISVDISKTLDLVQDTADVHFGITLTSSDFALLLDGGPVHVNPKLMPGICTDLDLAVLACIDLDLVAAVCTDVVLAPLDCVEA